jgi:hypothetical protein
MQRMFGQLRFYKARDHGSIDLLGHFQVGMQFVRQCLDLGDDLLDPLGRSDVVSGLLESAARFT